MDVISSKPRSHGVSKTPGPIRYVRVPNAAVFKHDTDCGTTADSLLNGPEWSRSLDILSHIHYPNRPVGMYPFMC